MTDPEIEAMHVVSTAVAALDIAARRRVIKWAVDRFLDEEGAFSRLKLEPPSDIHTEARRPVRFTDFVDLFHEVNPRTDADKALVSGYWFQHVQGRPVLRAQDMNAALKDLGHGLTNIADALRSLERRKPALVRQTAKSGRTPQARKIYKVTVEGLARIDAILVGSSREE